MQYDGSLLHEAIAAGNASNTQQLIDAKADVNARAKVLNHFLVVLSYWLNTEHFVFLYY